MQTPNYLPFSLLQNIFSNVKIATNNKKVDALLDDPAALTSIFVIASYLNIELPYKDISRLKLTGEAKKEFLRRYLTGLSIVLLELKTHNCCGIQHKFMKLYKHVLVQSAQNRDYDFLDSVLKD